MKQSELYLKLLRWGIYATLFVPLIIFAQYLSPFHIGKMLVFRSLVEIMAVIYILLIISNKKYLPSWKPIVVAFTVFTGFYALTSFTAVDFSYAFWGTLERMGGLFSFLHFWVFFIILVSIFRDRKSWDKLLKIAIFVGLLSILFAYGQHFIKGKFFIGWQHGERIIGTIGNPALFAGYLLFILFLSIYFMLNKKISPKEKGFYAGVFILGLPIFHLTVVKGSIIAFWGALFLLGLIYLFLSKNKKLKLYVFVALIIFLILAGFIWLNKDQSWVKKINWINKITNISLKSKTLQTRLWSWDSGFQGWKEKPILGWGPENFVLAHAQHFDPRHFAGIGSETIWDRAHNIILEMLTTMGIVGLLSYLSIFVVVYYLLIKNFKKKKIDIAMFSVFSIMLIAYFFHNLFIFDTTANYLLFFLVLGYINFVVSPAASVKEDEPNKREKRPKPILAIILIILAVILIYKTNIEPARANFACTRAILAGRAGNIQEAFDKYQQALSYKSPQGKYEIRHRLTTFVIQLNESMRRKGKKLNRKTLYFAIEETRKNIEVHPLDYIPYLYAGRIYILLIPEEPELAGPQAEAAIQGALAINDRNPRVWYELGQAKLSQLNFDGAIMAFTKALELNPDVKESNWFLGMTYGQAGDAEKAIKYLEKAIELKYSYKNSITDIMRLIHLYSEVGDYYKVIELYKDAIEEQPGNAQSYASLAATYKTVGDIENAIWAAQKAEEIDPSFKDETDAFINSLK